MILNKEQILSVLKNIIDPEIGVNIVDLGLIYSIEKDQENVYVTMTMTSRACPLHEYITESVSSVIKNNFPWINKVTVKLVWDPPWGPEMMSEEAQSILGWS